ncbi:GAF and ANTAR domain-containing protein [Streptomyces sp. NPDC001046]|uniref:GAF and ANTAR domain-containing protein n=1 Tax=Streptomyces sp. NPDC001046 TaxID=3364543 RepID=UPI0036BF9E69
MSAGDAHDGNRIPQLLLRTDSLEGFLQALADTALELARCEGVGLTLERHGRPATVVSSGPPAPKLDEKQYGQDDGPCLQSLRTGQEVAVRDMREESRWGDYPAYAASHGIRSSLSLPIAPRTHTAGALNLYAESPAAFEGADLSALRDLASQATGGIALAQRIADAEEFAEQLQNAMRSRGVIDQAIGVVIGRNRCTAEEAFKILRSASQHRNIKMRDLCTELITSLGGRPPTTPDLRHRP